MGVFDILTAWLPLRLQEAAEGLSDSQISERLGDAAAKTEVTVTLLDLVLAGGWAMIPLALLMLVGTYVFFERWLTIRKANSDPEPFLHQVRELVRMGDVRRAEAMCAATDTPFARLVLKGIRRLGSPLADIAAGIETEAKLELNKLEKSLAILATVSGAAPMIGFLGTVTGLITAFMTISHLEGNVSPSDLAGGIYEAMVTTAAGLVIGIPAYLGYNILSDMISNVVYKMEISSTQFIDLLQEPVRYEEPSRPAAPSYEPAYSNGNGSSNGNGHYR